MCTGLEERVQNKLYLKVQKMEKSQLLRDKVSAGMYETRTTLLVVGETLRRTDKLLCGLAAGVAIVKVNYVHNTTPLPIAIVHVDYVYNSHKPIAPCHNLLSRWIM